MKLKSFLRFLVLLVLLSGCAPRRDLTFVSWSDTHFDAVPNRKDTTSLQIIDKINHLKDRRYPDSLGGGKVGRLAFLVTVGDITGDGLGPQWDSPDLPPSQSYVQAMKSLDPAIRAYEVLGNHDYPSGGPVPGKIKAKYGRTYYAFDVQGVHFIVLDPYLKSGPEHLDFDDAQLAWVAADLKKAGPKTPVILAMHNHPDPQVLADVLRGYNVVLILHGHYHVSGHAQWNGIDVVVSGFSLWRLATPSWSLNPKWTPTFLVVRITNDRLTVIDFNWEKNAWGQVWVDKKIQ